MSPPVLGPAWLPDLPVMDARRILVQGGRTALGPAGMATAVLFLSASTVCLGQGPVALVAAVFAWRMTSGTRPGFRLPLLVRLTALLGVPVGFAATWLGWTEGILVRGGLPPAMLPAAVLGGLVGLLPLISALLLEGFLRRQLPVIRWGGFLQLLVIGLGLLWGRLLHSLLLASFPMFGEATDAFLSGLAFVGLVATPVGAALVILAAARAGRTPDIGLAARRLIEKLDGRPLQVQECDWGLQGRGRFDGVPFELALVETAFPPRIALRVPVPGLPEGVRIEPRPKDGEPGLEDPVLGRLVAVRGLPDDRAGALVENLHEEVLSVVGGRPGSRVEDGAVVLVASLDPAEVERWPDPRELASEATTLALALAARLDTSPEEKPA